MKIKLLLVLTSGNFFKEGDTKWQENPDLEVGRALHRVQRTWALIPIQQLARIRLCKIRHSQEGLPYSTEVVKNNGTKKTVKNIYLSPISIRSHSPGSLEIILIDI